MKYLKTFEDRKSYNRESRFKYLNNDDTIKVKEFVKKYIDNLNIFDKVGKLKLRDFEDNNYEYFLVFESFFTSNKYSLDSNNIYFHTDIFCDENGISSAGPALRNTLGDIISELYKEYNKMGLKDKIDKKLIKLLEKHPKEYEETLNLYEDELNNEVKKACEWMLNFNKFNL